MNHVLFLLGSELSIPAGMDSTNAITETIPNGKGFPKGIVREGISFGFYEYTGCTVPGVVEECGFSFF